MNFFGEEDGFRKSLFQNQPGFETDSKYSRFFQIVLNFTVVKTKVISMKRNANKHAVVMVADEQMFSIKNLKNYVGVVLARMAAATLGVTVVSTYFTYVFTEFFGITPGIVSLILMIGIFFDGITDICMGAVMDHVITKSGKAKHWFLWMPIPVGVTMALMFFVSPNAPMTIKIIYAVLIYNIFCTCITTVRLPAITMISLISDMPKVRGFTGWMASIGHSLGSTVTGIILGFALKKIGGDTLLGYRNIMILFSLITIALLYVSGFLITEKRTGKDWQELYSSEDALAKPMHKRKRGRGKRNWFFQNIFFIITNRYWLLMQVGKFFGKFISGLQTGTMAYFCLFVLGDTSQLGSIVAITGSALFVGTILGLPLLRFLDGVHIIHLANFIRIGGCILAWLFSLNPDTIRILMIGLMITWFCEGLVSSVEPGLVARIIDYGEWKYRRILDGMTFGGNSVLQKITIALSSTLCGYFLASFGYAPGMTNIPQFTIDGISFLFLFTLSGRIPSSIPFHTIALFSLARIRRVDSTVQHQIESWFD
ncbi:MAG: MFS transporter, partial [Treponema sp.]|nr:MFS transporter [Treponema sp.]